ncbi:unnamed protein product [Lota lota]
MQMRAKVVSVAIDPAALQHRTLTGTESQGGSQMNTFSSSSTQADHRTASSHRKGRTQRMSLCMSLCLSGSQRWD